MLCDDLEVWDEGWVGGRLKRKRIYVYLQLIHVVVQQKLTQHCKAIILQFKKSNSRAGSCQSLPAEEGKDTREGGQGEDSVKGTELPFSASYQKPNPLST